MDLNNSSTKFPTKILSPLDLFSHSNKEHQAMVDDFISILEALLGTKRVEFSIAERWANCPPPEAQGKSLKEHLPKVRISVFRAEYCILLTARGTRALFGPCAVTTMTGSAIPGAGARPSTTRTCTKGLLCSSGGETTD